MKILTIANKKEEKILRKKTADFDPALLKDKKRRGEIDEILKKIKETMVKANGVGLAANQIGLDMQVFIARIPEEIIDWNFYVIFNPKITEFSKEKNIDEEGCLSVPGIYGSVERFSKIIIAGQDKNGKKIKFKADGLLSRIFQHEIDHLNGILFIDKAKNLHKAEIVKNL